MTQYLILSARGRPVLSFDTEARAREEFTRMQARVPGAKLVRETRTWEELT